MEECVVITNPLVASLRITNMAPGWRKLVRSHILPTCAKFLHLFDRPVNCIKTLGYFSQVAIVNIFPSFHPVAVPMILQFILLQVFYLFS